MVKSVQHCEVHHSHSWKIVDTFVVLKSEQETALISIQRRAFKLDLMYFTFENNRRPEAK
jgi:hypothetical protein